MIGHERTLPVRWLGVLTLLAALTPIAGSQREPASSTGSANYLVNHTTAIFLIDPQGRLREYVGYNVEPQRLADGIRAMTAGT